MQHGLAAAVTAYAEAQLGRSLTTTDRERHDTAAVTALWLTPGPSPVGWRNFRTRLHGEITAEVGPFTMGDAVCRNYSEYIFLSPQADLRFQAVACYDRKSQTWSVWPRNPDRPS
jgi:surface antigen